MASQFTGPKKDPRQVTAGLVGMNRRWGPPQRLDLRDLTAEQRVFVIELVRVARAHLGKPDALLEARIAAGLSVAPTDQG